MSQVQESVDVEVPVRVAYDQWTQFESFPEFMDGVESITQISETRNHWVTKVGGVQREFETEITEQHPDERVAWTSVGGDVKQAGVVTFHRLSDTSCRVTVQIDWEPQGVTEKIGAAVGVDDRQVKADTKRFKAFIESRGAETGAWRGDVPAGGGAATGGTAAGTVDAPGPHDEGEAQNPSGAI
ncbi:cyclase [Auraticoccus sp. F435]|uniref:Cyclase n=1 Tax=Auraticoccus cholistanensis TaxID=2656650 RepID=A0A6A9UQW5_9ACTN|nr:SRPBCC family protein [Auraticoccus cholistanensis]MVA74968.1 cyclase [Auraticoccus cholistanensis]